MKGVLHSRVSGSLCFDQLQRLAPFKTLVCLELLPDDCIAWLTTIQMAGVRDISFPHHSFFTSCGFLEMEAKLSKKLMAWLKDKKKLFLKSIGLNLL